MSAPVLVSKWNYPTTIWSGPGRIAELPQACRALGMKAPLLITDQGLADSAMVKACIT